jgi:hypothetical protein
LAVSYEIKLEKKCNLKELEKYSNHVERVSNDNEYNLNPLF